MIGVAYLAGLVKVDFSARHHQALQTHLRLA